MSNYIRRLNDDGIKAFEKYIQERISGNTPSQIDFLLTDERYSEALVDAIEIDPRTFDSRYEMGLYLSELFKTTNIQPYLGDTGFWSWLGLFLIDQLAPSTKKTGKPYNYILSKNYNHRPRHAVLTSWMLVDLLNEKARFLLSKKMHERGDLIEQLAARQHLINCPGVMLTAHRLYADNEKNTFKRGSTSSKRKGNIRRFINYLQQLELTYDLGMITEDTLIDLLPEEYSGFLA